jgi:8-oxo-dGTP diphosphatase
MISFCPTCGHDLGGERRGPDPVVCPGCHRTVWFNPKPCSGALVIRGGKAMLSRRAIEPALGAWDVPGGFCHVGEHPEETARRELFEETGLRITLTGLLGIFMDVYGPQGQSTMNLCYLARIPAGATPHPADDISAVAWFGPDELPPRAALAFHHTGLILDAWRARTKP